MDARYRSSIPSAAIERAVMHNIRAGLPGNLRRFECVLNNTIVGLRAYDSDGTLIIETPLKDGLKHGIVYHWYEANYLASAEPYVDGKLHGTAQQWDQDGNLMGTYTLSHGTGFDLWRGYREDGSIFISEIHSFLDGVSHGFEWWLNEDQRSVFEERHWWEGKLHGIERCWNENARLRRGWPRYYMHGSRVTKRQYLREAQHDITLVPFRDLDQLPNRNFPPKIEALLAG